MGAQVELGYALSSEEHRPLDLVRFARAAENAGFTFAGISDHYHPWIDEQGQSPYAWSTIGAIAVSTTKLRLLTGVTCPFRYHPALVAQAAATVGAMMEGRFILGLGTGEALNEHILGGHWPEIDVRQEMLEESVDVIRELWKGRLTSHRGNHFQVEQARVYTLPEKPVPIYIAAGGERSAALAGRAADGLVSTAPNADTVAAFEAAGGQGKPKVGMVHVCWAPSEEEGIRTVRRVWPNGPIKGAAGTELRLPSHFEALAEMVDAEDVAEDAVCGPDPERHIEAIQEYVDAGFDSVYVHQVGPDQEGFFEFYGSLVLPHFAAAAPPAAMAGTRR
jgi:G6PDH family F420-dependent oxidoreductase